MSPLNYEDIPINSWSDLLSNIILFTEFEEVKIITAILVDDKYQVFKNIMEVDC